MIAGPTLEVSEIRATALAEAEACLSTSYCDHSLAPAERDERVDFRHRRMRLDRSGFNFLQYGHEVTVRSRGFEEFYMLEMPLAGGVDVDFGAETLRSEPGKALILSPGPRFSSRWRAGTRQWMLQIDRKLIEARMARIARRQSGQSPVFNPVIDLSNAHGRSLAATVAEFADLLDAPAGEGVHDIVETALATVVDELLRNIAFTSGGSVVPERLLATPRHVKQAIDVLKSRYAERLLIPALATEIGISERALYEGFQTYYQRSPHDILTRIRMDSARRLIREEGCSASEAACQVGIRHFGRFSATYREIFGILPSAERHRDH